MAVVVSMLRGVNVGGHNKIKMEALRQLSDSLGLKGAQSYIQSGNVVFKTKEKNLSRLASRIVNAIEQGFGFRPNVILRTHNELNEVIRKRKGRSGAAPILGENSLIPLAGASPFCAVP